MLTLIAALVPSIGEAGSPFDQPAAEATVAKICAASETEPFIIVDSLNKNNRVTGFPVDVNGDLEAEASHGDVARVLYEANGKTVVVFNLEGNILKENMLRVFTEVADQLEAKTVEAAAVNVSLAIPLSFERLNRQLNLPFTITPDNLADKRTDILAAYQVKYPTNDLLHLIPVFQRIEAAGTPILVSAGNEGPENFNLMSLFPGTITVGSLNPDGSKASYSADNSLVAIWRLGEYYFKQLPDGSIDVNGDGTGDFVNHLTGQPSVPSRYAGRNAADEVKTIPPNVFMLAPRMAPAQRQRYLSGILEEGIYRTDDLTRLHGMFPGIAERLKNQGEYLHSGLKHAFRTDAKGALVYDPEGSGDPSQVIAWGGTSFAPPNVCEN